MWLSGFSWVGSWSIKEYWTEMASIMVFSPCWCQWLLHSSWSIFLTVGCHPWATIGQHQKVQGFVSIGIHLPSNEHPTFLPNLISWIDLSLGYPSLAISSLLTLALYGCLFAVIAAIVMRSHASEGNLITVLLLALVFFSSYRLVFLSIPVNNSHILVNLFASFAIICFHLADLPNPREG